MRVDAEFRIGTELRDELHFACRRQIEKPTLGKHRLHDSRVRQGFQRVVQIDSR